MVRAKPAASFVVIAVLGLSANPALAKTASRKPAAEAAPVAVAPAAKPAPAAHSNAYRTIGVGLMSWPEATAVSDGSRDYDAKAQFYTAALTYAHHVYRVEDGLIYEGSLLYGEADIQDASGQQTYFQKRVAMYGLGASVGWFFRPEGRQVNIGFSLPLQWRHASWSEPNLGGSYSVHNKDRFAVGATLDLRWRFSERFALAQKVGALSGYKGALWVLSGEFTL